MTRAIDVPVLIVGGGPTGLCASILLSRHGIRSLLVERHTGTAQHPKIRGENVRTMEIVRPWGIEPALRASALPSDQAQNTIWLTSLTGQELRRVTMGYDPALYQSNSPTFPCGCAQDGLEPTLLAHARTYTQGELLFHHELRSFVQDADGVSASIVNRETGKEFQVRASYLIGADGVSSLVRQTLGVPMPGPVLGHLMSILFHADLAAVVEGRQSLVYWVDNLDVAGMFVAVNNTDRWNFHVAYHPEMGESIRDFTGERCTQIVRKAVGLPELPLEIVDTAPWTMAAQVAEEMRRGRVFLAGDAAHVMPPMGGYGMNTGIADVHNLAWKLAAALSGWASLKLLETYQTERLPVGRFVTEQALMNAQGIQRNDPSVAARFQGVGIALGYAYDVGAIVPDGPPLAAVADPVTEYIPTARPGSRAPHYWLEVDGRRTSTIDLFDGHFVLLSPREAWCASAERAASHLCIPLVSRAIADDTWAELYGVGDEGAVLVRPDGYVAWRTGDPPDADALADVFSQVLGWRDGT